MRPLGEILLDMEPLLLEMVTEHDLQWSDVLSLVYGYLQVHTIDAQEIYEDGSNPVYFYGPKEQLKKMAKRLK